MNTKLRELSRTYFALLVAAFYIAAIFAASAAPRSVKVIVDGKEQLFKTNKILVRDILKENRIKVSEKDIVRPGLSSSAADANYVIEIKKARRLLLSFRGFKDEVYVYSSDIAQELVSSGYKPGVSYVAYLPQRSGNYSVIRIERLRTISEEITVYFDSKGKIISSGDPASLKYAGMKKQIIVHKYAGNTLLASTVVSEKLVRKPTLRKSTAYVYRGTKRVSRGSFNRSAEDLSSRKEFSMVATAYAPGAGAGHITATGRRAGYGIAAVDPRVIPLGTKLYIPGYGYAVAADTGGAIKGNRIDLCFNTYSEAIRWGRRQVKVYIIQ